MQIDFVNMITELGYGLGAAIVLYMLYNRLARMNERTVELQTTLADTLTVLGEHVSVNTDIKSATTRAAEMDRLYQSNHEMMIAGHATIIDSIPASVEQLAKEQQHLSEEVNGLLGGLNAFAESSLNGQRELQGSVVALQNQSANAESTNSESNHNFANHLERVTTLVEQLSRGMALMVSSNETNFTEMNRSIVTIERKLMEEF